MNRFIWARIVLIWVWVGSIFGLFFVYKKDPFWLNFALWCLFFLILIIGILPVIVWFGQLLVLIFKSNKIKFHPVLKEVWKDLWAGNDNQMASYNEKMRRKKLESFE